MSANPDRTASDVSCRILVLSSRISQARSCIARIQSGGKRQSSPTLDITSDANTLSDSSASSESLIKIPWTITNKYYSAPVHFAAHRMHGLSPHQVQNIPAIIFVWSRGESYKHHIERIVQDLSGYEPEVCLAMRLAPQESSRPPSPLSDEEGEHDDVEIDGFLSSHGFEFIDAIEKDGETLESDTWSSSEIPGIERVLDALSTVMWPSMTTTSKVDIQKRDREHALLDWAITSQDHSLSAVEKMTAKSGTQTAARTKAKKQEMEELARLLENYAFQDDPWKSAASTGGISMTPAVVDHYGKPAGATKVNSGFDDDFTVFVSAPAVDPIEVSGRSTPDIHTDGLSPAGPYAGHLYRTLGSASDLGGSEDGKDAEGNDTDDELPSKEEVLATCARIFETDDLPSEEEILATSSRIFGTSKNPLPPVTGSDMSTAKVAKTSEIQSSAAKTLSDDDLDAFATENSGTDGDGSYDMEHFDLSKVFGALQAMKAEIANMEDESERRRAAARVALGVVYGLGAVAE